MQPFDTAFEGGQSFEWERPPELLRTAPDNSVLSLVVLVVQWLSVGLVIERSLVRLPAGALSSQLGQLRHPSGVGKSSTALYGWG